MTLLKALEKQIAGASSLIEGVSPAGYDPIAWEDRGSDFLCAYGLSAPFYDQVRPWLDEDVNRRLVFVEDRSEALAQLLVEDDAILLLNDLRVKIYYLQTPLQIESIARQIAWSAVLLQLEIVAISQSDSFDRFKKSALACHKAAGLLLSDAADWGRKAFENSKVNLLEDPCRRALAMQGAFRGMPALVIGAGPSLEKNRHLLTSLRKKALLFASSSSCPHLPTLPHFAAAIDPTPPLSYAPLKEIPFCAQARAHPMQLASSELLLAPDNHFPFLSWLSGEDTLFDGGWTVGTFMIGLAHSWGCNPIVLVGMDYAYDEERKYPDGASAPLEGLVQTTDKEGRLVWTQSDWLMAKQWTEEFARSHPDCQIINATEGGLGLQSPIAERKLSSFHPSEIPDLDAKIEAAIRKAPHISVASRWKKWKESLERAKDYCQKRLQRMEAPLEEEIVYEHLLRPLWQIWHPVFARQLDLDPHKIAFSEKMKLNETLFFQQVIEEHLDVYR